MIIFRTMLKIMKRHRWSIILPLIIFIAFAVTSRFSSQQSYDSFRRTKPLVALINHDSQIGEGLRDYLDERVVWVDVKEEDLETAVFYHQIDFGLSIPEGFTERFLNDGETLKAALLTDSTTAYIAEEYVNNYLHEYKALYGIGKNHTEIHADIVASGHSPKVTLIETNQAEKTSVFETFSNLAIYPLFICITGIMVTILVVFDEQKVFKRMVVSSTSNGRRNLELFLSAVTLGHALFLLIVAIEYFTMHSMINIETYGWSLLNLYCMFWVSMSASFAISKVIQSRSMQTALINSLGLGLAFVSGVFVPTYLLDASIVKLAQLFPVYWNVEANRIIGQGNITLDHIAVPLIIQAVYCVILVVAALIISRRKMESNA